ncbi:MAG: hypothetical protein IKO42_05530 [Opitutales bacterium]|nr:hypothetical protein [Opitutales bacterium]
MNIFKNYAEKSPDTFSEKLTKDLLQSQKIMGEAAQTAAHKRVGTIIAQSLYEGEKKRKNIKRKAKIPGE